ncbi:MAG: hypothetical protein N2114_01305 [Candidatus Goldbacteria bacterium]|nr:hypothetical protein [Candidatus Goldiibacteriota bacterium]
MKNKANEIIKQIVNSDLLIECPRCGENFKAQKAWLFYLDDFTNDAKEKYNELKNQIKERELEIKEAKKNIKKKSEKATETINIGFISERLASVLQDFKFDHNDCRSLGEPIDYIIFEGLNKKGYVTKMFFVDIKTGKARLNKNQKNIKEIIQKKKVEFDVYGLKK